MFLPVNSSIVFYPSKNHPNLKFDSCFLHKTVHGPSGFPRLVVCGCSVENKLGCSKRCYPDPGGGGYGTWFAERMQKGQMNGGGEPRRCCKSMMMTFVSPEMYWFR